MAPELVTLFLYYFIFILECLASVLSGILCMIFVYYYFSTDIISTPPDAAEYNKKTFIDLQAVNNALSVCSAKLKFKISKQGLVLSFHFIHFPCGLLDQPNPKYLWHLSLLASLYSGFSMQHTAKLVLCTIFPLNCQQLQLGHHFFQGSTYFKEIFPQGTNKSLFSQIPSPFHLLLPLDFFCLSGPPVC